MPLQVNTSMTVRQKSDKQSSMIGARRRHAIIKKQKSCTYPILTIILLVHHVWGLSSALQFSLNTAHMVPQTMPHAGKTHMQPGLEAIFKAAEKLLQQTACQSVFFPRETTSTFMLLRSATFSSDYGLGAAADTVCCFKATLLPPHEYRHRVKNWLSGRLAAKPLTASRLMFGLQTTTLIAMVAVIAVGMLTWYRSPETDGLFHSAAALLYLLYCIDLFLGQPKLDMALIVVVLFPQFGMAAIMQLAAIVAPLLLVALYAVWAVACRVSALALLLHELWLMSPMLVVTLLTIAMMICYVFLHRQICYLLGTLFPLLFMVLLSHLNFAESPGVWRYVSASTIELLHKSMQLCFKCAPMWIALAKPLGCLSFMRFVGLPTLQFVSDTFSFEEKFPVQRLVSIARVYTSMGMLLICCSEHMVYSLLLLLLLIGGIEPNPGPAMNILAICVMMVLSPRPRNSLELAGRVVSAILCLFVAQSKSFSAAVLRCYRPYVQRRSEIAWSLPGR